jgi:hypothetical protein
MDGSSIQENIVCVAVNFWRCNSQKGLVWLRTPVVEAIVMCEVQVFEDVFHHVVMNFSRKDVVLCASNYCIGEVRSAGDLGIDELADA